MTLFSILFFGCNTAPPPQLEAFRLTTEADFDAYEATLSVTVLESDRDVLLSLRGPAGQIHEISLHSPAASPFPLLEGATVDVTVLDGTDLLLKDTDGLVYAGDAGDHTEEITKIFGREIVSLGSRVQNLRQDGIHWEFFEIDVHSDAGTISLLPGEAEIVELDGVSYRVTAIAAHESGDSRPLLAQTFCLGNDVFSYEIIRVANDSEPEFIERHPEHPVSTGMCGDSPPE